ncbi:uncharacterized protein LOC131212734 [Anopheles bellator]|uniref:uncharacterized protein LOC131212734 n=1 Tax=Anopheles bellator TaxID=139047 RepID=UPI0026479C69|nr:uncharacterized protein LOC131212734 [Anopheles bellator]
MDRKPKELAWSDEQTFDLLEIIAKETVTDEFLIGGPSARQNFESVYKNIAKKMWLCGHIHMNGHDIQARWEKLQRCYIKAELSGDSTFAGPFYEELHELLSGERKRESPTNDSNTTGESPEESANGHEESHSSKKTCHNAVMRKIKKFRNTNDGTYYKRCQQLNEYAGTLSGMLSQGRKSRFNKVLLRNKNSSYRHFERMLDGTNDQFIFQKIRAQHH